LESDIHFRSYLAQFFLEGEMFQTEVVEKLETHILYSVKYFLENRAGYEIIRKNVVESKRQKMTKWSMRI